MKTFSIVKSCFLAMVLLASCDKGESYTPMHASALHNGVLVSCVEASGSDLLSNENFLDKITIHGVLSNKDIPFEIKKIKSDGIERHYLSFNADLPDKGSMKYKDATEAEGVSTVVLKMNGQEVKLLCTFKYTCSSDSSYGNNLIAIESVEYEGKTIIRKDHIMNSDIIVNFVLNNKTWSLE